MGRLKTYGLVGYPVKHSLSPLMYNAAFNELGVEAEYKLFEVRPGDLENFLLIREDVRGFNVTIPYKVSAFSILRKSGFLPGGPGYPFLVGAINTVSRDDKSYFNTDAPGFIRSLREDLGFEPSGKEVLVLGCGGAGRAVIGGLLSARAARVHVYELNADTRRAGKEYFFAWKEVCFLDQRDSLPAVIERVSLLVNATPVGMKDGDGSPVERSWLHGRLYVYDVVYNRVTRLLKDAKGPACGGLGMLLWQGVLAFGIWTKMAAPVDLMRSELERGLNRD